MKKKKLYELVDKILWEDWDPIGGNNLYLTNSDGNLIVISLNTGNVLKIEKVGRDLISKPLIYNENLFIVKNGSITQYD